MLGEHKCGDAIVCLPLRSHPGSVARDVGEELGPRGEREQDGDVPEFIVLDEVNPDGAVEGQGLVQLVYALEALYDPAFLVVPVDPCEPVGC